MGRLSKYMMCNSTGSLTYGLADSLLTVRFTGARAPGLQPAHKSDDWDRAQAPSRPPLSGLRGNIHLQPPHPDQLDWPPALQPTRSDTSMYTHHVHFTPGGDDTPGQHEVHHDLSSPRSHSSQGSRSSMASVATAPPSYSQYINGMPTR